MIKATSVVSESENKRLAFAGMLMHHVGVLPDQIVEKFSRNEFRAEIPDRLLHAFELEEISQKESVTLIPPRPHIEVLHETPKPCAKRTADEQIADMKMMYNMLGWTFTESGLIIPERRKGFDRLVVVGDLTLTNNRAYDACDASFRSRRYTSDLNISVPSDKDERHPTKNGVYAVWFRDRVEADEELKNLSADDLISKEIKGITLLERELFELVYFMETGDHLDKQNWTLCSGSRNFDGDVPGAYRNDGRFKVCWFYCDNRDSNLRSREAVSL
ncbi:MAG: hypothetical protein WCW03_03345 [Candidatus Paceibacterota bacterium]|jgi:hypothetical protein